MGAVLRAVAAEIPGHTQPFCLALASVGVVAGSSICRCVLAPRWCSLCFGSVLLEICSPKSLYQHILARLLLARELFVSLLGLKSLNRRVSSLLVGGRSHICVLSFCLPVSNGQRDVLEERSWERVAP